MYHILKRFAGIVCACMCVVLATGNAHAAMICDNYWVEVSSCTPDYTHSYTTNATSTATGYFQECSSTPFGTSCTCHKYVYATACASGYELDDDYIQEVQQNCSEIHIPTWQCVVTSCTPSYGPWTNCGTNNQQRTVTCSDHNAEYRCQGNFYGSPTSCSSGCTACSTVSFGKTCTASNSCPGTQTCYRSTSLPGSTSSSDCSGSQNCTTCVTTKCEPGKYKSGGVCTCCPNGSYTPTCNESTYCVACSGLPANAEWNNGTCATSSSCEWCCSAGYYKSGSSCALCADGKYTDSCNTSSSCSSCSSSSKPSNSHWTGPGTSATNCPWECDSGYTNTGSSCVASSCSNGQYWNGSGCGSCTNKPASNATYTGPGTTATNCPWQCNANYYKNGSSCSACSGVSFSNTCSITNGTGIQTCYRTGGPAGATSSSQCTGSTNCTTCTRSSCNNGYYTNGSACSACTGLPDHAHWTGPGTTATNCSWVCDSGYTGSSANGDTGCAESDADDYVEFTTNATYAFTITFYCGGTFTIDCGTNGTLYKLGGDGTLSGNTITKTNPNLGTFRCGYSNENSPRTIRLSGTATVYSSYSSYGAIDLQDNSTTLVSVSGSFPSVFPQLGTAISQCPRFAYTFKNVTGLTTIPSNLFHGYTGGCAAMFQGAFYGCTSLTSIPVGLFSTITTGAAQMFNETFGLCTGLTSVPSGIFASLTTVDAQMFRGLFYYCSNMGGYIPPNTFAGLINAGSPTASSLWYEAFNATQLLTSCPTGTVQYMTGYEGSDQFGTWNGKVSCIECPGVDGVWSNSALTTLATVTAVSGSDIANMCYIAAGTYYDQQGTFTWSSNCGYTQ